VTRSSALKYPLAASERRHVRHRFMSDRPQPAKTMRSLERALEVLGVLEQSRKPLRLTDVARQSGLHIATAQRILAVLERFGYVTQERGGYAIGVTALANAHAYLVTSTMPQVAGPVLDELAEATGLTASISVPVDLKRVLVARVDGASPLRYQLPVGQRLPIHVGTGRVVAAYLPEEQLQQLIDEVVPFAMASGEVLDEARFRQTLDEVRTQGYATSQSERVPGAASVGAPVLDSEGRLLALLQVSGHVENVDQTQIGRYVDELARAAMAIKHLLP
jgi:IclR family transcriptional regulator, acetate operon repressor